MKKNQVISIKVSQEFKDGLKRQSEKESRTMASMLVHAWAVYLQLKGASNER